MSERGNTPTKTVTGILVAAGFVIAALWIFTDAPSSANRYDGQNTYGASPPADADSDDTNSTAQQYTKDEFRDAVTGKTKAEIRAQFGSPDRMDDSQPGVVQWVYYRLPVYDAEAGTQEGVTIGFVPDYLAITYGGKCVDDKAKECALTINFD